MQSQGSKHAINGGHRSTHLSQETPPAIGHRGGDRQQSVLEPCGEILLQPYAKALFLRPILQRLDPMPDFTDRQDTKMKSRSWDGLDPCNDI